MPQTKTGCLISLFFALLLQLLAPHFFSSLDIDFLVAPIVFSFYSFSFPLVAWISLLSGCLHDALWLAPRLGFLGLSSLLTTLLLFPSRLYFFKDALSTPLILTFLFSLLLEIVSRLLSFLFGLHFDWNWTNALLSPLQNMAGCFALFLLPHLTLKNYNKRRYAS